LREKKVGADHAGAHEEGSAPFGGRETTNITRIPSTRHGNWINPKGLARDFGKKLGPVVLGGEEAPPRGKHHKKARGGAFFTKGGEGQREKKKQLIIRKEKEIKKSGEG